jgi:hypothetical protein
MENINKESQKSRIEEVKDAIQRSREKTEEEFSRTPNSWLACFGSSLFVAETYLDSPKVEKELGTEKYKIINKKLEDLKQKLYDLKQIYPEKKNIPPDEIKEDLLKDLENLI